MPTRTIKQNIELFGKGALIGVANTVPGVSGGTIAVVTGIYDELMESIAHFIKSWKFLSVLILGAGAGILIFARIIEYLMVHFPFQTLYVFMGLILGGLPFLWKKADFGKRIKPVWMVGFILSFTLILFMGWGSEPGETVPLTHLTVNSAFLIFIAGMMGAAAMIIPGVSGSFLLLLIGMYSTFIGAVNDMNISLLMVAAMGMAVGILLVARVMTFFLNHFPKMTYAVIIGLVAGSLVTLWPGFSPGLVGVAGLFLIPLGAVAGYFLGDR